jgi:hypothetical protein
MLTTLACLFLPSLSLSLPHPHPASSFLLAFGPALGQFASYLLTQPEPAALSAEVSDITLTDGLNLSPGRSPLELPSWRTHTNSDRDVLEDVSYKKISYPWKFSPGENFLSSVNDCMKGIFLYRID